MRLRRARQGRPVLQKVDKIAPIDSSRLGPSRLESSRSSRSQILTVSSGVSAGFQTDCDSGEGRLTLSFHDFTGFQRRVRPVPSTFSFHIHANPSESSSTRLSRMAFDLSRKIDRLVDLSQSTQVDFATLRETGVPRAMAQMCLLSVGLLGCLSWRRRKSGQQRLGSEGVALPLRSLRGGLAKPLLQE